MVIIYVSFNTVLGTFAFELYHHIQQQQQEEGQRTELRHPLQQAPLHFQLHKSYNQKLSKPNIIQDTFTPYEKEEDLEHPLPFKIILISSISELSPRHFVKPNHIYKLINNTGVIIHASKLSLPYLHHQHTTQVTTGYSSNRRTHPTFPKSISQYQSVSTNNLVMEAASMFNQLYLHRL